MVGTNGICPTWRGELDPSLPRVLADGSLVGVGEHPRIGLRECTSKKRKWSYFLENIVVSMFLKSEV